MAWRLLDALDKSRIVCRISWISGESIDVVDEEATDVDGVEVDTVGGVYDALTAKGGTIGLPAALISLCTDERLPRVVGIVTPHKYLKTLR